MTSPQFFDTPAKLRSWLEKHHESETELWVGFYKTGSGRPSITWPESVTEALCVGWIDGIRKSIDAEKYMIRFTPRKAKSIWSNVNIRKTEELVAEGRMAPAGLAAYALRTENRSGIYAFENKAAELDVELQTAFRKNRAAWKYFSSQPPYYRRVAAHYVASAKRPETRAKRLAALIEHSAQGERLPQLASTPKGG
ncbi:MAG: YdeI/OmpD-associated family protein [Gemmatimonadaceae bacterium]